MKRWITTSELGDALAARDPRVAKLSRWRRAEYARRLVKRAEEQESVRCIKRVGRRVLVSVRALALLLPSDVATVDRLDVAFAELHQNHRTLRGQVNGHGSQLRDHGRRLKIVEKQQAIIAKCQADLIAAASEL